MSSAPPPLHLHPAATTCVSSRLWARCIFPLYSSKLVQRTNPPEQQQMKNGKLTRQRESKLWLNGNTTTISRSLSLAALQTLWISRVRLDPVCGAIRCHISIKSAIKKRTLRTKGCPQTHQKSLGNSAGRQGGG